MPIELNAEAFQPGVVSAGSLLTLETQPGLVFTVTVSKVTTDVNGTLTWVGQVQGTAEGYFLLSSSDGKALGSIEWPGSGERFFIRYDPALLNHVAHDALPEGWYALEDDPPLIPSSTATPSDAPVALAGTAASDPMGDNLLIDVMIVYTPAARSWAGGTSGMNSIIAQAIARGQLGMDNTRIPVTLRLVHAAEVSYTESGNSNTDLNRLTNPSDGYIDEIHTWRDTYGADLVAFFTRIEDTGGLGWLLSSTNGQPTYAFSITRAQQASFTYTTIHEWGHNMGAHHRRDQATQPGPGLYSYSAGWRWTGTNSGKYASIMSYEEDGHARVPYWSSPTNSYMGAATGTATDDNARTIHNVKGVIAAYRTAPSTNNFALRAVALTNSVVLRWTDPAACGFATRAVHIRYSTADYPAATNSGAACYTGTNALFTHTGLTPNQPYYYTIWVSDDGSTFIEP